MNKFSNPQLEIERITSKVLQGILMPNEYDSLFIEIAGLIDPDFSDLVTEKIEELKNKLLNPMKLLKEDKIEQYFKGKLPEVYDLFCQIEEEVKKALPLYNQAVKDKMIETELKLESIISQQTDYPSMSKSIDMVQIDNDHLKQLDQTHLALRKMEVSLRIIIETYEMGNLPSKKLKYTEYSKDYKMYIDELYHKADDLFSDGNLAMNIYQAIDVITRSIPKDDLNPMKMDECKNLVTILMNPDSYYSYCKKEEVYSLEVANAFHHVYPEYYHMFLETYMDEYDNMDQQEQINFRKCFVLPENSGELVSLCSASIHVGQVQQ